MLHSRLSLTAFSVCIALSSTAALAQSAKPGAARQKTPAATATSPAKAATRAPGVNEMFAAAQVLYQAGKFEQAITAYDAILRRFPGHEPTIIQYAKSLYRINRISDSYPLFARVNPQYLDPETSYEFGQAFMSAKQYEGALFAFKRVPNGHALSDLASYYGALAAMKLRRYQEAEDLMDNAVVLPDKLSKSRTIYMKHLTELRLLQEKRNLAIEKESERRRLASDVQNAKRTAPTNAGAAPAATKVGYVHNGFHYIEKGAHLGINYKNQIADYSGFGDNSAKIETGYFRFLNGTILPLNYTQAKNQAAAGLQIRLEAEDVQTEGVEKRLVIEDDTPTIVRVYSPGPEKTHYQNGIIAVAPWLEIPAPNNFWASVFSEIYFNFPEFERGGRTGSREGGLGVGWKHGMHWIFNKIAYLEVLDPDTKVVSTRTLFESAYIATSSSKLSGLVTLRHQQFTYSTDTIDGPDGSTSLSVAAEQKLPLNIVIGISGGGEYQKNFIANNIPNFGAVAGDGQIVNGKVYLAATPTNWFTLGLSQSVQKTTWTIAPAEAQEDFERVQPNYLSQFVVDASLNLLF